MNVTEAIQEALRDFMGDADGVDVEVLEQHDRQVQQRGFRKGYEMARQDMLSGAFIGGPTYEALKHSHAGHRIAAETLEAEARSDKYDRPCEDRLLDRADAIRKGEGS